MALSTNCLECVEVLLASQLVQRHGVIEFRVASQGIPTQLALLILYGEQLLLLVVVVLDCLVVVCMGYVSVIGEITLLFVYCYLLPGAV